MWLARDARAWHVRVVCTEPSRAHQVWSCDVTMALVAALAAFNLPEWSSAGTSSSSSSPPPFVRKLRDKLNVCVARQLRKCDAATMSSVKVAVACVGGRRRAVVDWPLTPNTSQLQLLPLADARALLERLCACERPADPPFRQLFAGADDGEAAVMLARLRRLSTWPHLRHVWLREQAALSPHDAQLLAAAAAADGNTVAPPDVWRRVRTLPTAAASFVDAA